MHPRLKRALLPPLAVLAIPVACTVGETPPVRSIEVPAGPGSTSPNLAGGLDSRPVLSWLEADGSGYALRFSVFGDRAWASVGTVARSDSWFVNWADFPSVVPISEGLWAAHWLVKRPGGPYAYDIAIAISKDGGRSWSDPVAPHRDGTLTEHGFVSLYPDGNGVGIVWLDGRNMLNEDPDDPTASGLTLRAATLSPELTLAREQLLDGLVCDCCQTDVAISSAGPVAAYRNRTRGEIRDIHVARYADGQWHGELPVAHDNWEFAACPVNGPAIDAKGNEVVVAWFSAVHDEPLVQVAFSGDAAQSFEPPIEVDRGDTLGRVGVAILGDGEVAVSSLCNPEGGSPEVCIRRVTADGQLGPLRRVSAGEPVASNSVPQMVLRGDTLLLAWTARDGEVDRVRSARVAVAALN